MYAVSHLIAFYRECVQWAEGHLFTCPSKKYFHIECPGCGFQRSLVAMLKGDFQLSFQLYPATVPILVLLTFMLLHIKWDFGRGAAIIKYLQLSVAIVIVVFYIYKLTISKIPV